MSAFPKSLPPPDDDLGIAPSVSLVTQVAERLTDAILRGRFVAGERLVETRVADKLGVSRSPLREALQKLEADGLVVSRRGRGTFVAAPEMADYERMVPVRATLEGQAARLLAGAMPGLDLGPLEARNAELKAAAASGDLHAHGDAGWRFHRTMVELSDNPYLLAAWQSLSVLVRHFMHNYDVYMRDIPLALRVHDLILETIRAGDPDRAERSLRGLVTIHGFAMVRKPVPDVLAGTVRGVRADGTLED